MDSEKKVAPVDSVARPHGYSQVAFVENLVRRKTDYEIILRKLVVVFLALLGAFLCMYVPLLAQYWYVPLLVFAILGGIAWNYQNMEYEFSLTGGDLDVVVIHAKQKRKKLLSLNCRDIQQLSPMRKAYKEIWGSRNNKIYYAASHPNSKLRWFALFYDTQGKKSILIFEPTEEMLAVMKRYVSPQNYKE